MRHLSIIRAEDNHDWNVPKEGKLHTALGEMLSPETKAKLILAVRRPVDAVSDARKPAQIAR